MVSVDARGTAIERKTSSLRLSSLLTLPQREAVWEQGTRTQACSWMTPHDRVDNVVLCEDGTYVSNFRCVAGGHGQRAKCRGAKPVMCADLSCGGGQDHCCIDTIAACHKYGGIRPCQAAFRVEVKFCWNPAVPASSVAETGQEPMAEWTRAVGAQVPLAAAASSIAELSSSAGTETGRELLAEPSSPALAETGQNLTTSSGRRTCGVVTYTFCKQAACQTCGTRRRHFYARRRHNKCKWYDDIACCGKTPCLVQVR